MASGKTHEWVTVGFLPPVLMACRWGLHLDWPAVAMITVGTWVGGFLLSPDLDTRSRPFYRWGVFRFIWWPYQWVAKHRSGLSHGVILAPWLRLLYLSAVLIAIYTGLYLYLAQAAGLSADLHTPRQTILTFLKTHLHDFLLLGAGIWLGSLIHIILDRLSDIFGGWVPRKRARR
ncbi:MAG TPA: metal-binding protein [Coleofasciculaceae cyanobacterium]|jgi:uncharacterized metal-binding protein